MLFTLAYILLATLISLPYIFYVYTSPVYAQSLTCQINGGVVSCPPVACPGAQVVVTFTSTVQNFVGYNLWVLPTGTCGGSTPPDSIILAQGVGVCKGTTSTCGPYTATNADPGNTSIPCLTSNLTVTATSSMLSSVIQVGTRSLVAGQSAILNTTQITVLYTGTFLRYTNAMYLWLCRCIYKYLKSHD